MTTRTEHPESAGFAGLSAPAGTLRVPAVLDDLFKVDCASDARKVPAGTESRRSASRLMNNPG